MNEEEKKAIEVMKSIEFDIYEWWYDGKRIDIEIDSDIANKSLQILLNLIEKLKLENNALQNTKDTCPFMATSGIRCENKKEEYIPKSVLREKIDNRLMKLGKYRTYYYKDDCGLMISVNSEIQNELELLLEELLGDEL